MRSHHRVLPGATVRSKRPQGVAIRSGTVTVNVILIEIWIENKIVTDGRILIEIWTGDQIVTRIVTDGTKSLRGRKSRKTTSLFLQK